MSQPDRPLSSNLVSVEMREHYRDQLLMAHGTGHYDGCWNDHYPCALAKALDEIERLQSENGELQFHVNGLKVENEAFAKREALAGDSSAPETLQSYTAYDQVPYDILDKAVEVRRWFQTRNLERWAIGGIGPLHPLADEIERLRALLREWWEGCPAPPEWHWSFNLGIRTGAVLSGDSPAVETSARETAWLVEDNGARPRYRTMDQTGIHWTEDVNKAIRFARRADAEMFSAGDEDAWHVVEHEWVTPSVEETSAQRIGSRIPRDIGLRGPDEEGVTAPGEELLSQNGKGDGT